MIRKLFPVLLLTYSGAIFTQHAGQYIALKIVESGKELNWTVWSPWISIAFFSIAIFCVKKWNFQKIYLHSLALSALTLLCAFVFRKWEFGSFVASGIGAKLLTVAGWAFVNHRISSEIASKSYFLLHFLVGLAIIPMSFLPQFEFANSAFYFLCLITGGLMCLVWAAVLGIGGEPSPENKASSNHPQNVLSLALLMIGIQIILSLNDPIFKYKITSIARAGGAIYFTESMKKASVLIDSVSIALAVFSVWLGPLSIRLKNWSFPIAIALLGTAVGMVSYFFENLYLFSFYRAFLFGLQYFWMFPLVQIAFSSLPTEKRFTVQAFVCLVLVPLMENLFSSLNLGQKGVVFSSLILLFLMYYATRSINHVKTPARQIE